MTFTKWFAFLGLVVMLAACGGDMVIEKSFDASAEEPADDEDSSNSSDKEKSSDSKNYSSSKEASSSSSEPAEENKGKTIYGAAQKGPFLAQSVVKIYELKKRLWPRREMSFLARSDQMAGSRSRMWNCRARMLFSK